MVDIQLRYSNVNREAVVAGLADFNNRMSKSAQETDDAARSAKKLSSEYSALESQLKKLGRQRLDLQVELLDKKSSIATITSQLDKLATRNVQIEARVNADTKSIADINNQLDRLKKERVQVELDFGKGSPELDRIDAKIARLQQRKINLQANTSQTNTELEKVNAKINQLTGRRIALTADVTDVEAKLNAVNEEISKVGGGAVNLAQVTTRFQQLRDEGVNTEATFKKLNSEFGVSRAQFDSLRGSIQPTTAELTQLAAVAAGISGAGLAFFGNAIAEFTAANANLVEFSALSQTAVGDLDGLTEESRKLAIELKGLNAADIVSAGTNLVTLGASAEEAQERLRGVSELAVAAVNGDTELAGIVIQSTLNAFEKLGESSQTVSDQLAQLRNNSAASVEDVQQLLAKAGALGADIGVPFAELSSAFGVLRNQGLSAEVASTGLRNVLLGLTAPTSAAAAELNTLNLEVFDGNGEFRGLTEVLAEFQEKTQDLSQEQRIGLLKTIFGKSGLSAASGLLNEVNGELVDLTALLNDSNGVAGETAANLNQGLAGALGQLSGAFSTFNETVGQTFAGVIEPFVRAATALLSGFVALPQPVQTSLVAIAAFGTTLAGAVAVLTAYELIQRQATTALVLDTAAKQLNTITTQAGNAAKAANTFLVNLGTVATRNSALSLTAENVQLAISNARKLASAVATKALAVVQAALALATSAQARAQLLSNVQGAIGIARDKAATVAKLAKTAATSAGTKAQLASALATGKGVVALGALAGAAAAALVVRDTFKQITQETEKSNAAIRNIDNALNELDGGGDPAEEAAAGISEIEESLNPLQRGLDVVRGAIPGLSTAAESAGRNASIAFSELSLRVADVGLQAATVANKIENGIAVDPQEVASTVAAIDASIAGLEELTLTTEEEIRNRDRQIAGLREYRGSISNTEAGQEALAEALDSTTEKLKTLNDELGRANSELENVGSAAAAGLAEDLEAGIISYEQYQSQLATIEENGLRGRITAAQDNLVQLRELEANTQDIEEKQEVADQILDVETKLNNDRQTLSENRVDAVREAEEEATEAIEKESQRQASIIDEAAAQNRAALEDFAAGLEAQVDLGELTEGQADAQVALRSVNDELETLQKQVTAAQTASAGLAAGTPERAAALAELANLQADVAAQEREATQAQRDLEEANEDARKEAEQERIDAIETEEERAIASLDIQADLAANVADAQIAGQERVLDSYNDGIEALDAQLSRVQSIGDLINDQFDLRATISDQEISTLEEALDIREKLDGDSIESAEERADLERQIAQLGLQGQTTEQIRNNLVRQRADAADEEREALILQQQIARQALDIEAQKQVLADNRAIIESRIAIIQQQASNAALEADRQRLLIQQQSLQNQLSTTTDDDARADLELAIQQSSATLQGVEGQITASRELLAIREQDLLASQAAAAANQEALARQQASLDIQQQNQRLQLANQQAAEARALANELAAEGEDRAAQAAARLATEASNVAEQEERRALALLASSQNAQQLNSQLAPDSTAGQFDTAVEGTTEAVKVSADTVEEKLSASATVWNDSALSVQDAFLASAQTFQQASTSLAALVSMSQLQDSPTLPGRRTGGEVKAGSMYQLHKDEVVVQRSNGYVLNAPQTKLARSEAMRIARKQMASQLLNSTTAMPAGSITVLNKSKAAKTSDRLESMTGRMAADIGSLKAISQRHLLKAEANSRAIARMEGRKNSTDRKANKAERPLAGLFRL